MRSTRGPASRSRRSATRASSISRRACAAPVNRRHYTNTSPPIVFRNLVIVGNGVGDRLVYKGDPPGDVRAFDARTGKQVWRFNTVPGAGEFGNDTWGNDSWKTQGHTNVWAPMSLDDARGLLYLPVSTPSNDFYGGDRPGANLFGESIVCLDAATGVRRWHFQIVHHGLWDYDAPSAPALVSIDGRRQARRCRGVADEAGICVRVRSRHRPADLADRGTAGAGERRRGREGLADAAVSRRSRRRYSPQGVTLDDAFDLTPELKAQAQAEMKKYRIGPLYTPPSTGGTLMSPGIIGGANWGGVGVRSGERPAVHQDQQSAGARAHHRRGRTRQFARGRVGRGAVGHGGRRDVHARRRPPGSRARDGWRGCRS